MRPVAPIATELRLTGSIQLAIGLIGLAGSLAQGVAPARALVAFAVTLVLVGGLSLRASGWLRRAETTPVDDRAAVEAPSGTIRRTLVALTVPILAVLVALVVGPGLAAVLGGVVTAVGAVDLRNLGWVRAREGANDEELLRELGASPFSSGRRPLYTRPIRDITLAT